MLYIKQKSYCKRTVWSYNRLFLENNRFVILPTILITKTQEFHVPLVGVELLGRLDPLAGKKGDIYFLAPFFRCSSSRSRWASSLARCCARFSAAVIRGMMSSKGLSTILIDLILGGLLHLGSARKRKGEETI